MLHRQLTVHCGAYVEGFIQGADATLTIYMGVVNSIVAHRLFRKISEDHHPQWAKTAPVDAAGMNP